MSLLPNKNAFDERLPFPSSSTPTDCASLVKSTMVPRNSKFARHKPNWTSNWELSNNLSLSRGFIGKLQRGSLGRTHIGQGLFTRAHSFFQAHCTTICSSPNRTLMRLWQWFMGTVRPSAVQRAALIEKFLGFSQRFLIETQTWLHRCFLALRRWSKTVKFRLHLWFLNFAGLIGWIEYDICG